MCQICRSVSIRDVLSGEEMSLYDVLNSGRGSVTSEGSAVLLRARLRTGEAFRVSYQVVRP